MAVPKHLKGKLAIIALKDAATSLDDEEEDMDSAAEEAAECTCPKCGHTGPESEFKD